jgi:hypothetical protein
LIQIVSGVPATVLVAFHPSCVLAQRAAMQLHQGRAPMSASAGIYNSFMIAASTGRG